MRLTVIALLTVSNAACSKDTRLSVSGESCSKTADCVTGLRCIKQTCLAQSGARPSRTRRLASSSGVAKQAAIPGPVKFTYTPTNVRKCRNLNSTEDEGRTDLYRCRGLGPYSLQIMNHDHGCELTVLRRGQSVLTVPSPFNGSVSSKVAEWRYRVHEGKKVVHALIFRMYYPVGDGSSGKRASKLYVTRLSGSRPCLVGVTTSNELARQYADDESRACIDAPI